MSEYIVKCNEVIGMGGEALIVPDYIDTSKEVVRCRDCENYEYREHLGRGYCRGEYATEPDGFCAWAERCDGE